MLAVQDIHSDMQAAADSGKAFETWKYFPACKKLQIILSIF